MLTFTVIEIAPQDGYSIVRVQVIEKMKLGKKIEKKFLYKNAEDWLGISQ